MKSFSNHFLISMPHINDPIFEKSLIYICKHDINGAMGLMINKPFLPENSLEIIKKFGFETIDPIPEIYFGGPVNIETSLILHDKKYNIDGTIPLSKHLSLTSNQKIVKDINSGTGPVKYCISFGYSGWSNGQIEKEIENGDWLVMPADYNFIFNIQYTKKWEKATSMLGIDMLDLGGSAGIA